jgi:hypothetical protein
MLSPKNTSPRSPFFLRKHISITVNSNRKMKNDMEDPACLADLGDLLPAEVLSNFKGNIVFNIYIGETLPQPLPKGRGENTMKDERGLPEPLATEKAMALWKKAQEAGYVDENYQPLISRTQSALLANAMAARLGIREKWKVFETFWGRKYMRNDYSLALSQLQSLDFQDELKQVL